MIKSKSTKDFITYTSLIFLVSLIIFAILIYDAVSSGGLLNLFDYANTNKATEIEFSANLLATYIGVAGAFAIGFAGAWVAIRIAENTAHLQKQANDSLYNDNKIKTTETYLGYRNNSITVFRNMATSLAEITKVTSDLIKVAHATAEDNLCLEGRYKSKEKAISAKNAFFKNDFINALNSSDRYQKLTSEFEQKIIELITSLITITENDLYSRIWRVAFSKPLTRWIKSLNDDYTLINQGYMLNSHDLVDILNFLKLNQRNFYSGKIAAVVKKSKHFSEPEYVSIDEAQSIDIEYSYFNYSKNFNYITDTFIPELEAFKIAADLFCEELIYTKRLGTTSVQDVIEQDGSITRYDGVPDSEERCFNPCYELFIYLVHSMPNGEQISCAVQEYMEQIGYDLYLDQDEFQHDFNSINYFEFSQEDLVNLVVEMRDGKEQLI